MKPFEVAWLTSDHISKMVQHLYDYSPYSPSDRKLRLFTCACQRFVNTTIPDRNVKFSKEAEVIENCEKSVDGLGKFESYGGYHCGVADTESAVNLWVADRGLGAPTQLWRGAVLRDIFGNPYDSVCLPVPRPSCEKCGYSTILSGGDDWWYCKQCFNKQRWNKEWSNRNSSPWLTSTVVDLARRIYDNRDYDLMPILGDALEDAGCTEEKVLWHCRGIEPCPWCLLGSHGNEQGCGGTGYGKHASGRLHGLIKLRGPHVRGCWIVDMILGYK